MKKHYITFAVLALFLSASGHSLSARSSTPVSNLGTSTPIFVNALPSTSDSVRYESMSYVEARMIVHSVLTEMGIPSYGYSEDTELFTMGLDSLDIVELTNIIECEVLKYGYQFDAYYFETSLMKNSPTLRDLILITANSSSRVVVIDKNKKK